jgi:hypothetical protein
VGLTNLGSESETCVGSRVRLVGVSISFEKNFYWLPFTPPSLVRHIGPSVINNMVWTDSWPSIVGAGCGLICVDAGEEWA